MLIRLTLPHFHCQWICVIFSFYSKSFIHLIKNVSFPRCLVLLGNHFSYCFALFCWIDFREFNSVQFSCSVMSDSLQPHGLQHARPPFPSPTPGVYLNSCSLSQWCQPTAHPLLSPSPHTLNLSQIRVFSNESARRIRWPKYWSFTFSISPSSQHPGLIFRMEWLGLLAVQRTLKSLLQHHSSADLAKMQISI